MITENKRYTQHILLERPNMREKKPGEDCVVVCLACFASLSMPSASNVPCVFPTKSGWFVLMSANGKVEKRHKATNIARDHTRNHTRDHTNDHTREQTRDHINNEKLHLETYTPVHNQ